LRFHRDARTGAETVYVVWQRLGPGGDQGDAQIRIAQFDGALTKLASDVRVDDSDGTGKWHPVVSPVAQAGHPAVVGWTSATRARGVGL
jgi:hypothetical protein